MNDLSTLPVRLPPIQTQQGPVAIERIGAQHADMLAQAGNEAAESVHPWLGKAICPVSIRNAQQLIKQMEASRHNGFGIAYILNFNQSCLGMGVINYIHPLHKNANLGYWLRPSSRGQGLAFMLCKSLQRLAFNQMDLIRLELYIEPQNTASIKLAERLNAHKEGMCQRRIFGKDALLYSIV